MPRIGRQIAHFEQVDLQSVDAVFSKDKSYRYLLSISFSDTLLDSSREKTAMVLLKNPSAADEKMADATIRKVETYIYHRLEDVRKLYILNLFAVRATDPQDVNDLYSENDAMSVIGEENDRVIESAASESDYVILAWGNNSGIDKKLYEERIVRVKNILAALPEHKCYIVKGKVDNVQPLHGLMWGYDYELLPAGKYLLSK